MERTNISQEEEEEFCRLNSALSADAHEVERITPERWKALMRIVREPGELEKWFENFLDSDLRAALRCKACGRAFLITRVVDDSGAILSYLVLDEDGDEIDLSEKRPRLGRLRDPQ